MFFLSTGFVVHLQRFRSPRYDRRMRVTFCNRHRLTKWSGLTLEAFTDADKFGVTFPADWDTSVKAVFLGAVFLIDFAHFENKGD